MRTVGRRRGWHVAAGSGQQRPRLGGGRAAGVLPRGCGGRRQAAWRAVAAASPTPPPRRAPPAQHPYMHESFHIRLQEWLENFISSVLASTCMYMHVFGWYIIKLQFTALQ